MPVDLNSLLYGLENAIRAGCERRPTRPVREFAHRATARRAAIDRYLWDERRCLSGLSTGRSGADAAGLGSDALSTVRRGWRPTQAVRLRPAVQHLLRPGGIVTTPLKTGEQWDAPNGWAPMQWIAVAGLRRYGRTRSPSDRLPLDEHRQ